MVATTKEPVNELFKAFQ